MFLKFYIYALLTKIAQTSSYDLKKFNIQLANAGNSQIFLRVLQKYDDFYLIMHVDNTTKAIANTFLEKHSIFTTIYNHDLQNTAEMTRPGAPRCLNLAMFENPFVFSKYLSNHNNIHSYDVIMFLATDKTFGILNEKHHLIPNLSKSGRVIVIKFEKNNVIAVNTMCFYCGQTSGKLLLSQKLSYGQFVENPVVLLPYDFRNLNRHVLRVVYIDYFPYIYCIRKRGTICENAIGSENDLLKALSHYFNFNYELIEAPNKSYDALIDGLVSGDYDFAIGGVSITNSRRKILQFSNVLRFEDIAFIFVYDKPLSLKFSHMKAESVMVLISLICMIAIILYLVIKYTNEGFMVYFCRVIGLLARPLFEQPIKLTYILPKKMLTTIYIILGSWYLFVIILNVIYKSKLNARLVYGSLPPSTLNELINEGYTLVIDKTKLENYLNLFSKDETIILNSTSTTLKSNLCELVLYIQNHKAIITGEIARVMYHTALFCGNYTTREHHFSETFTVTPHAWCFKTAVPFVEVFSTRIRQIMNGGLLKVWKQKALVERKLHKYQRNVVDVKMISVVSEGFFMQCVVYVGFMFTCVVVFTLEIICHDLKKGKRSKWANLKAICFNKV